jgi:MoxR-like ATPase
MTMETVEDVQAALAQHDYLADEGLATAIFLAIRLQRPLLLEGEAGVGKTEVAKVLARWTGGELVRLQCYEGIDSGQAVYEWDYSRQLLHLRAVEAGGGDVVEDELYSERFLVKRPLMRAIAYEADALGAVAPPVLLVDEVDRADDEFEAFLLEILSDYTVTVPELGTFHASVPPLVVVTSNRTRDVHDALKRRCLYHWIAHPDFERELAILRVRAPEVPDQLAREVAAAVESLRDLELYKPPGVAETIDWANALAALGRTTIDERSVEVTLGTILKYREDQERTKAAGIEQLVRTAAERSA